MIIIRRELVWQLLVYSDDKDKPLHNLETIQREACVVITNGLSTLYPTTEDKNTLMMQLLSDSKSITTEPHCVVTCG